MAEDTSMAEEPPVASTSNARIAERSHIRRGDTVLLQLPSKAIRLVKIPLTAETGVLHLGRYGTFDCVKELVGKSYGVTYEVVPGVQLPKEQEVAAGEEEVAEEQLEEQQKSKRKLKRDAARNKGKDRDNQPNRELSTLRRLEGAVALEEIEVTEATNEKIQLVGAKTLDPEVIHQMKREGVSGREIIDMQIAEHGQFALKNEFSKAKYKNRKEAKYLKYVIPLPPTIHNLCEYWWGLDAKRIRDLRPDTLAQILAVGNIRPGSRVLVVDDTSGLLTAAVVERLGGKGTCFVIHPHDSPPPNQNLPLLNMPESFYGPSVLKALHWGYTEEEWQAAELPTEPDGEGFESERQKQRMKKRHATQEQLRETIADLKAGEFDALLVSSPFAPMGILERLLPLLDGSAQIVFHSATIQPLSELLENMLPDREILNPTILEPWLRQYQVLPGRTHPTMNGIAHGGYLLHAVRVFDTPVVASAMAAGLSQARSRKKRRL